MENWQAFQGKIKFVVLSTLLTLHNQHSWEGAIQLSSLSFLSTKQFGNFHLGLCVRSL